MTLLHGFINKARGSTPEKSGFAEGEWARVFAQARAAACSTDSGALGRNKVVIVSPSGDLLFVAALPASVSEVQIAHARNMLPQEPRRTVAVIADTRVSGSVAEINKVIPFVGMLMGLAYVGHCVVVFDGQLSTIEQGCRDADVLIVDGAVLPHLHHEWYSRARHVMRTPGIYMHDRKTYTLRPLLPVAGKS